MTKADGEGEKINYKLKMLGGEFCTCAAHNRNTCRNKDKNSYYICSRPRNHKGRHIACGLSRHQVKAWNRRTK